MIISSIILEHRWTPISTSSHRFLAWIGSGAVPSMGILIYGPAKSYSTFNVVSLATGVALLVDDLAWAPPPPPLIPRYAWLAPCLTLNHRGKISFPYRFSNGFLSPRIFCQFRTLQVSSLASNDWNIGFFFFFWEWKNFLALISRWEYRWKMGYRCFSFLEWNWKER